ncbi:MAG: pyridoxamine 5'-phosphate oxidase family protein [Methylophilaceae bacterium]
MAQRFDELGQTHIQFIGQQQMFFVATASSDGRVNLSPKGLDAFRVMSSKKIAWLSLTGSGNETAAHLLENARMTIMFCAFVGKPHILRLYGQAHAIYEHDAAWAEYVSHFELMPGTRQIFVMDVDLVQTSCGMAVPMFDHIEERNQLLAWAEAKGKSGIEQYWQEKNQMSIDQKPTGLLNKSK